jgi:hypothetical protein
MEIKATIKPGQNGTKRYMDKYGDRLLCVRYRYDKSQGRRYTTVELIVAEGRWAVETGKEGPDQQTPAVSQMLAIQVDYRETELRDKIKAAGGIWRPRQKLWELRYSEVVALGLESRVVEPEQM